MAKALRVLAILALLGGLATLLAKTDNPLSRYFEAIEARRTGFARPGTAAGTESVVDLAAYRRARNRCGGQVETTLASGADACPRCMVDDCMAAEAARFKARGELGIEVPER